MRDKAVEVEVRIEFLHKGILPYRTRLATLEMRMRSSRTIWSRRRRPPPLNRCSTTSRSGSVFTARPPAWRSASDDALEYLIGLGRRVRESAQPPLSAAIDETIELAEALLAARRR